MLIVFNLRNYERKIRFMSRALSLNLDDLVNCYELRLQK